MLVHLLLQDKNVTDRPRATKRKHAGMYLTADVVSLLSVYYSAAIVESCAISTMLHKVDKVR